MSEPNLRTQMRETAPTASRSTMVSALFRENNRALIRFLLAHLADEQEAQEVAQEAYVRLLQLDRAEAISFLRTYLFRIAANLAIDRLRRKGRAQRFENAELFGEWAEARPVERAVLASQELTLIKRAVEELKPKCRFAFIEHKFNERPVADIAREMQLTPRMVRIHIARALLYCRLRIDGYGPADAHAAAAEVRE